MRRRTYDIAAGLSLPACLLILALWARSYWVADGLSHPRRTSGAVPFKCGVTSVVSAGGVVELTGVAFSARDAEESKTLESQLTAVPTFAYNSDPNPERSRNRGTTLRRLGFGWNPRHGVVPGPTRTTATLWSAHAPHWVVALLLAMFPTIWRFRRSGWTARRRIAQGLCPRCGYDLRESPECCPECGEPSPPRRAVTASRAP